MRWCFCARIEWDRRKKQKNTIDFPTNCIIYWGLAAMSSLTWESQTYNKSASLQPTIAEPDNKSSPELCVSTAAARRPARPCTRPGGSCILVVRSAPGGQNRSGEVRGWPATTPGQRTVLSSSTCSSAGRPPMMTSGGPSRLRYRNVAEPKN